jgi:PAS domain S-box-containing protein
VTVAEKYVGATSTVMMAAIAGWAAFRLTTGLAIPYLPHKFCLLAEPSLLWTHVITDSVIALSYFTISLVLVLLLTRSREALPFRWVFLAFGLFIVACGATHLMEVVTVWVPYYWLSAAVKLITAVASAATAIALVRIFPQLVNLTKSWRRRALQNAKLLDLAHDGIFVLDWEGNIQFWNQGAERCYGWTAQEAVGKSAHALLKTQFSDPLDKVIEAVREKEEWLGELVHTSRSGKRVFVQSRWGLNTDERGNPVGTFEINRDISEYKRAQDEVRDSEQRLRTLADNISQLVWMANADGYIFWYNRRWYEYTGTTAEQMAGWGWQSVHDPNELPKVLERWKASIRTGEPFDMVFPLRGADGIFRPFLTRIMPIKDEEGNVIRWFGTNTDISEQKKSEEALVKAEKLASVGRLAATIVHEINNPLETARNAAFLIKQASNGDEPVKSYASIVEQEISRAAHIARNTLSFYREAPQPTSVDIKSVIDNVAELQRKHMSRSNIILKTRVGECGSILGYPGEIRQILSNLVRNAAEAIKGSGKVVIAAQKSSDYKSGEPGVRIFIADNGSGISADAAPHLFMPFFTTKGEDGTGVGLWITRQLVEKQSGTIRLRSRNQSGREDEKTGTVFMVWFPLQSKTMTEAQKRAVRQYSDQHR